MRIRRKPWAKKELEQCEYFKNTASEYKGRWSGVFQKRSALHLELGCGKGDFISKIAANHPEINYIAIDVINHIIACAIRNIKKEFNTLDREVDNVILVSHNIERIYLMMDKNDMVDRIYINFCNPWPKQKHKKRRLTYPTQLEKYKCFLKKSGEIYFKTDDDDLFNDSIEYLNRSEFNIIYKTYDLHKENIKENILTEHEKMFTAKGINIKFLIAKLKEENSNPIEGATNIET